MDINPVESSTKPAIDSKAIVKISPDKKMATITITAPDNGGKTLTCADIEEALASAGVTFGIKKSTIEILAAEQAYNREKVVAEAILPERGYDGRIEFHFPTTRNKAPLELPDGSVDFKQLGIVKNVRAGDVLCTKIPPGPGVPGIDVTNEEIPPPPGKEARMPKGANTEISEDGSTLLAKVDGQVDLIKNRVDVQQVIQIDEDVGVATGDIDFIGNVVIKGNVLSGFKVRADGNVTVKGEVAGATINAGGNVFVEDGFNGMNTGVIEAGGDVRCKFVQNGCIKAGFNIESGVCVNSKLRAGSAIKIIGFNAGIISSDLSARHTIDCTDVGTETVSRGTTMEVGQDPQMVERSREIPKEQDKIAKDIEKIERTVDMFKKLNEQSRLDEEKVALLKKLIAAHAALLENSSRLIEEKQEIEQSLLTVGYGTINIKGTAYAGTLIIIGSERKLLQSEYKFTSFSRGPDGIITNPLSSGK